MTISTEVRKAGPFIGNGSASSFPFAFKVFKAADLIVVRRQDNIGVETTLVLDSDYHVTLNVNQDTTPGGVVALTGGALADGFTLIVSSELPYLQTTDLTNQGGFYPKVITNALDRLTIFCQQLAENLGRTLKLPITAPTNISTEIPLPNPSELLAWNETGTGLTTVSPQSLVTSIAYGSATADLFAGDGATTTFPLSTNPASVNNLDVSVGGFSQRPVQGGVGDYSWNGGASITFVTPPPAPTVPGDKNVLVRYMQAIPVSDSEALHAQTREALRRSYAEAGHNLVDGSFETGGTLTATTDVLLLESTGEAYAWTGALPKVVAPGFDPVGVAGFELRTGVTLRNDLSVTDSDISIAGAVAKGVANQTKTILDYGATCDGLASDDSAILAMAADVGYVIIPDQKTTTITTDLQLPFGIREFKARSYGSVRVVSGASIRGTNPTASSTQTITVSCGVPYISTSTNLSGKYIEVSNGLTDKIFGAETAPAGTIDPIAISEDDYNLGTYKAGLFKCTLYDAAAQRAYLDVTPDFTATAQVANIYDDVNHTVYENINWIDENASTDPADATIRYRKNYAGGMRNCTGRLNYVDVAYVCNHNEVTGNKLTVGYTFSFSWNCCDNNVHDNVMTCPKQASDSVLIFFKNCRRNKANKNTINGMADAGNHWSILFHTNSDHNEAIGNNVSSRNGIGCYAFNKGNLITDNDIDCNNLVVMGAVSCSYNANRIRCKSGAEFTVGLTVDFKRNKVQYAGALGGFCLSTYDVAQKPFGFAGFTVTPQNRINCDGTEFKYSRNRAAIDYRSKVDFTQIAPSYLPSTPTGILGDGVAAIGGYVQGVRRISTKGCTYKNIHVGVLLVCTTAGSDVYIETGGETFDDVSAAYIVKATDFNYPARCLESYGAHFRNVDIVALTNNWPVYVKGGQFAGVNSVIALASYFTLVYTAIIDVDNASPGSGGATGVVKWYDYLTSKPSAPAYSGQLTATAAHQFSYRVPRGAKYYQPSETMVTARTEVFENQSSPSTLRTIKRSITEILYS